MRRLVLPGLVLLPLLAPVPAAAAITTNAEHAILMDGDSGQVLWAKDAFTPMPPASMSKLMTLELLFQRLKDGRLKLGDTFPISERAWRERAGSECFVPVGARMTVESLIRCVIVASGNDSCIALAEGMGGTVEGFVAMMNKRAKELGLAQSHFVNPDGLPQPPGQLMSAMDLATLARHLIRDYPQYYHYFSERDIEVSGIKQHNRNLTLDKFPGADGLKTGHTDAAGYGVTVSAVRNGQRFILVLNGLRYPPGTNDWFAERYRADEAARILELAYREFRTYRLFKPGDVVGQARVWGGAEDTVPLTVGAPLALTLQVDSRKGMKAVVKYDGPVKAPVGKGQRIGTLSITAPDTPPASVPLYAAKAVGETGLFGKMMLGLHALTSGSSGS
ncbi:MAG TPA: D-alanyl-D-alanine carboxypeptidase family protein [Rhizomicrobium sp.]|jgi:D-alanyl-D-alanine carboxypeptidase (penicillin-binding protein 5/6)|nr:D-alanyl-D-alanine carboxypeptidase family protein [Rhizomicrobium sp.]